VIDLHPRAGIDGAREIVDDGDAKAGARAVERGGAHAVVARQPAHEEPLDAALAQPARQPRAEPGVVAKAAVGVEVLAGTFT